MIVSIASAPRLDSSITSVPFEHANAVPVSVASTPLTVTRTAVESFTPPETSSDVAAVYCPSAGVTIVAALVDTVLQNVSGTNRVRLLVNGEPAETLGGHVDLTRPLLYFRNEVAP